MKVLMVCLGNICRSPIAEGVLKSKLHKYGINGFVDSAGVLSEHAGESPDERAVFISKKNGTDISGQIARQFTTADFEDFDLILTMDSSVHNSIIRKATNSLQKSKVSLFLEYAGNTSGSNVPDPYFGGPEGFVQVYKLIEDGCERIAAKMKS
ncbi:MAG TPA: low molecular weight protein-tyrosine-phosphatase [Bacteroidia bacterium]|nr:low molecular weight protein-tyrosine-phosphatase [Bacteroidia bacterium]